MLRRSVLTGLLAAPICPICASLAQAAEGHISHWTYEGHEGPEHWGELSPEFKTCEVGKQQSPIDIDHSIHAGISEIKINWQSKIPLHIVNNGHTIQINCPPGSTVEHDGAKYILKQFHFHHPSEHLLDHKTFEMECHFVHLAEDGKSLTVLGVFITPGAANPVLGEVFKAMPKTAGEVKTETTIDMSALLPADKSRYFYEGSLTTPPCSEIVDWEVFRTPITASAEQIKTFVDIYPSDARPAQPLNRRMILDN
ncbi:MAG: carbonate dehydratase [Azospirillum sp.]|nr:carbonate dehydratase [Azospirillum sp.]